MDARKLYNLIPEGEENAITSAELEKAMNASDSEIYDCVLQIRRTGHIIIIREDAGITYFKPTKKEDIEEYVNDLQVDIEAICKLIEKARMWTGNKW